MPDFNLYRNPNLNNALDGRYPAGNAPAQPVNWRQNEPAGLAQGTNKEFNSLSELETSNDPNWYITSLVGSKSITQDAQAPVSPPNVLTHTYPAGFNGGAAGTSAGFINQSYDEIYVCLDCKWDENWQDHPTGTNKVFFITIDDFGGGGDPVFLSYNTQQQDPRLIMFLQGPSVGRTLPRIQEFNPVKGQHHTVEIYLKTNTADGVADGIARMWVDDNLVTDVSDVEFWNGASAGKFNTVKLEPTWGGSGGVVVDPFSLYHDQIYVAGQ